MDAQASPSGIEETGVGSSSDKQGALVNIPFPSQVGAASFGANIKGVACLFACCIGGEGLFFSGSELAFC